ncbi:MAG: tetratricopeptide repeat protein [Acidobacteria bacterium]|nr:tetratricopeptide repeat protein [Acidobacteriota bacterium]
MFRKFITAAAFIGAVIIATNLAAAAQTVPLSGRVVQKGADGKPVGVGGVTIDVYRSDLKGALPTTTTDKNGYFSYAGVMAQAVYIIAVSGPGLQAQVFNNIRTNQGDITVTVVAGNGVRLTEDQARQLAANPSLGENGTDAKKQQAEYEAKLNEAKSKNDKAQKTNQIVASSLKEGNDAFNAKNFDVAIAKYDEGITADPDFVGTAPVLLNNRGAAYLGRGTDSYNKAIKLTEPTEMVDGKMKAKADFLNAAQSYVKAWTVVKNANSSDTTGMDLGATKGATLRGAKDVFRIASRTELVDPGVIDAAKLLIPEYVSSEPDVAKKAEAELFYADLFRATGDYQAAIDAYKKVLEVQPDNPDALAMIGACYYALGAANNSDKAMYQEGANYLQKYISVAPDGHKYKKDVADILEALKKENVIPQKVPATGGGKKRGS